MPETTGDVDAETVFRQFTSAVFADRLGVLVFTGALLFYSVTGRLDVIINDTYTIADTLLTVSNGHVAVTQFPYGGAPGALPGLYYNDGMLVGRNYGQAAYTLPVYLGLVGLQLLAPLQVVLTALWAFLLYWFLTTLVSYTGHGSRWHAAGVTLLAFFANVSVVEQTASRLTLVAALQLTSMAAAAATGLAAYHLFRARLEPRPAALVAVLTAVATPIGFFSTVPKRHAFTGLFVTLALLVLYRAFATDIARRRRWYKALAYGTVGGLAWVHAPEGLLLLIAIVVGDLAGTRSFRPRDLAFSLMGLFVSLLPFFLLNYLVSGSPLTPPRRLPAYGGQDVSLGGGAGGGDTTATGDDSGTGTSGGASVSLVTLFSALVETAVELSEEVWLTVSTVSGILGREAARSVGVFGDTDRVWSIFVRRGYSDTVTGVDAQAIHLSLLEASPTLGALTAVVVRRRESLKRWMEDDLFATDVTGLVFAISLVALALPRLPIRASYTVRYLHPLFVLGMYALVRTPFTRTVFRRYTSLLWYVFAAVVVVGTPTYTLAVFTMADVAGEAVQLYALPASIVGIAVGVVTLVARLLDSSWWERLSVVALGVGFGVVTVYLIVVSVVVFGGERNLLPVIELLSERLSWTR